MGCQSSVFLGDKLTFSICTHDADTGALTDASAAPTYRVYEDETTTAIANGQMAVLDNGNTTGFYTKQLTCSAANGFEAGKTYTVYIEATVDGVTGGIAYGFAVVNVAAALAHILTGTIDIGEALRAIVAATAGKPVGVGTHTISFRDLDDTKDVLTATVDDAGNVTALTMDLS